MTTDRDTQTIYLALATLYGDWDGSGVSPSKDDECFIVLKSLGLQDLHIAETTIDELWEMDMSGADLTDIADAWATAIAEAKASLSFDEAEALGLDGTLRGIQS